MTHSLHCTSMGFDKCLMACIHHCSIILIKLSTEEFPTLFILLGCPEHQPFCTVPPLSSFYRVGAAGQVQVTARPQVSGIHPSPPLSETPRPAAVGHSPGSWREHPQGLSFPPGANPAFSLGCRWEEGGRSGKWQDATCQDLCQAPAVCWLPCLPKGLSGWHRCWAGAQGAEGSFGRGKNSMQAPPPQDHCQNTEEEGHL